MWWIIPIFILFAILGIINIRHYNEIESMKKKYKFLETKLSVLQDVMTTYMRKEKDE